MNRPALFFVVVALWVCVTCTPASAFLLTNGNFDAYGPQPSGTTPIDDWAGSSAKYNGTTHVGFGAGSAYGGANYGTVDAFLWGEIPAGSSLVATQAVAANAGYVKLTGAIGGGTTLSVNDPYSTAHFVKIEDGGSLSETFILPENLDGGTDWVPFTLTGMPDGRGITVTWGFTFVQDVNFAVETWYTGGVGILSTHVDELELVPAPTAALLAMIGLGIARRRRTGAARK